MNCEQLDIIFLNNNFYNYSPLLSSVNKKKSNCLYQSLSFGKIPTYTLSRSMGDNCNFKQIFCTVRNSYFHQLIPKGVMLTHANLVGNTLQCVYPKELECIRPATGMYVIINQISLGNQYLSYSNPYNY